MDLFKKMRDGQKPLIGMVHCLPLPGTYGSDADIGSVIGRAVSDAKCLEACGFDAVMVEDEDKCTEPHMTRVQFSGISIVANAVKSAISIPMGLCLGCLNYEEALAAALVVGGDFVRAPIFVDTVMNYNGIINPCSAKIIQYRSQIGADRIKIFADIQVKHYFMVNKDIDVSVSAQWASRQGADAVIVTGCDTGVEPSVSDIDKVRKSATVPVMIGSGVTKDNIGRELSAADALIIGTCLRRDGKMSEPIDPHRVEALLRAAGR